MYLYSITARRQKESAAAGRILRQPVRLPFSRKTVKENRDRLRVSIFLPKCKGQRGLYGAARVALWPFPWPPSRARFQHSPHLPSELGDELLRS
jgi:hypothetical protein